MAVQLALKSPQPSCFWSCSGQRRGLCSEFCQSFDQPSCGFYPFLSGARICFFETWLVAPLLASRASIFLFEKLASENAVIDISRLTIWSLFN
jgi:hypothetical protein